MQTRRWRYLAEDARGAVARGAVEAEDHNSAILRLKEQGLSPVNLEPDRRTSLHSKLILTPAASLSHRDTTLFCTRMADLLKASVPAAKALQIVGDQARNNHYKAFVQRLQAQLRKGKSLSVALAEDSTSPPPLMIALVASGEALGDLGGQFARLAESFETRAALRREITSQLIYPAALFVLIILTIIFLSFMVLPQFETVFSNAAAPPPPETRAVLAAGAFIREYWMGLTLSIIVLVSAAHYGIKHYNRQWEAAILHLPLAGAMARKLDTSRYCRSLGELLEGGMPLARAMPTARAAIGNQHIKEAVELIEADVRNGIPFSKAAAAVPALHSDANAFIELGEETGELGGMILKAADYLEDQIASNLKRFAALSGPIMTAIMGLLTAGVIAAVMTGVLSLNESIY